MLWVLDHVRREIAWEGEQDQLLRLLLRRREAGGWPQNQEWLIPRVSASSCPDWALGQCCATELAQAAPQQSNAVGPAPAAAGNQLCQSVRAALKEWRQRDKILFWSTVFPKALCRCQDSSCWSLVEMWDLPKEAPLCAVAATFFNPHCLSLHYWPMGKGIQFFWKAMAGFIFLYMNPHSIARFVHGTEHWAPNPHQSPWVCLHYRNK